MVQIDYEITTFYKTILHLFLALGALPPIPLPGGSPKGHPPWTPHAVNILRLVFLLHYELGSNAVIPLNTEDN